MEKFTLLDAYSIYKHYGITIVLFRDIFINIQLKLINFMQEHYANQDIILNTETKKIIKHFIITEVCTSMQNLIAPNKILLVDSLYTQEPFEIWKYVEKEKLTKFVSSCFKSLRNQLPFPIYVTSDTVNLHTLNGDLEEVLTIMGGITREHQIKTLSTKSLRKHSDRSGLTYIRNVLLPSPNFKKLLYRSA